MTLVRSRRAAATAIAALAAVLAGCATDPERDPDRPPGHAARSVTVVGDGVRGVHAEVVRWERTENNALPPQRTVRALVRFTADDEWTLTGTDLALAVCAITEKRVVVLCDEARTSIDERVDDPRTRVEETWITTDVETSKVRELVLLPDQFQPGRPPRSVDPKDGGSYVAPRFPLPGDRLR